MEEILHQLICKYPIIYRVLYIPGGCLGFLNHHQYFWVRRKAPKTAKFSQLVRSRIFCSKTRQKKSSTQDGPKRICSLLHHVIASICVKNEVCKFALRIWIIDSYPPRN